MHNKLGYGQIATVIGISVSLFLTVGGWAITKFNRVDDKITGVATANASTNERVSNLEGKVDLILTDVRDIKLLLQKNVK